MSRCRKQGEDFRNLQKPCLADETVMVRSCIRLAKYIHQIADNICLVDLSQPENKTKPQESLDKLKNAGEENVNAIKYWRGALGPEKWDDRVYDAIKATENTVQGILQATE